MVTAFLNQSLIEGKQMAFWKYTRENQYELMVLVAILLYTLTFSGYTLSKHHTFSTFAWDLGIFDQAFWTTVNMDKIFFYTSELHLSESGSFFGIHFSPILFTIIPFYYLHQNAETLLVIQSLILGLSALPIYKIANLYHRKHTSCLLSCLYLLNPALHGINSYDFHVQAFLPLILGYALYYTLSHQWLSFLIVLNLSLATQEQVVYLMFAYIFFLALILVKDQSTGRNRKLQIFLLFILSVATWKLLSSWIISYFNPTISAHLKAGQHYAVLGVDDPLEIPLYALTHPVKVFQALNFEWYNKLGYLLCLFTPYLIAFSQTPLFLIPTAPWFAISLLSNYPPYYRIGFQYSAYIVPFIYTGFIAGLNQLLSNRDPQHREKLIRALTVLMIITSIALSPLSPLTYGLHLSPGYEKPVYTVRTQRLNQIVDMVPEDASILTQDNIFPHFSNRLDGYVMIPSTFKDVKTWKDAITWITSIETDYILIDLETDPHNTMRYAFSIVRQQDYQLLAFYDNIYLYKKGYTGDIISYEPINQTYTYNDLIPQNMKTINDPTSSTGNILTYQNMSLQTRTLWYGPYEIAPRGNYTATFMVKTSDNTQREAISLDAFHNQTIINSRIITENQLNNNTWTPIQVNFTLNQIAYDLELRGFLHGENCSLSLDYIRIEEHR